MAFTPVSLASRANMGIENDRIAAMLRFFGDFMFIPP
jgi:hypothetical protein